MSSSDIKVTASLRILGKLSSTLPGLWQRLGNIETAYIDSTSNGMPNIESPAYICGLARSGSTILLEMLSEHPAIGTHRYRDFPFLLTPALWNRFYNLAASGTYEAKERAHKDRIMVTPESPEAMEEPLWMRFFPSAHDPTGSNVLGAGESNPEFEKFYNEHISKIMLIRNRDRYLAKGNYNITRIAYLHKLVPDARFIIPVREPVSHIASLMKQHNIFTHAAKHDRNVDAHMRRMGHFEFGGIRQPINANDDASTARTIEYRHKGMEAKGWAEQWASIYGFVLKLFNENSALSKAIMIVSYEGFCENPERILDNIYSHLGLETDSDFINSQAGRISAPCYYKSDFSDKTVEAINKITCPTMNALEAHLNIR